MFFRHLRSIDMFYLCTVLIKRRINPHVNIIFPYFTTVYIHVSFIFYQIPKCITHSIEKYRFVVNYWGRSHGVKPMFWIIAFFSSWQSDCAECSTLNWLELSSNWIGSDSIAEWALRFPTLFSQIFVNIGRDSILNDIRNSPFSAVLHHSLSPLVLSIPLFRFSPRFFYCSLLDVVVSYSPQKGMFYLCSCAITEEARV